MKDVYFLCLSQQATQKIRGSLIFANANVA